MNKLLIFIASLAASFITIANSNSVILDDFESNTITVIDKKIKKLLWNQYENHPKKGSQKGFEEIVSTHSIKGKNSLQVTVEKGHLYLQFYPKPKSNAWDFMHQHVATDNWQFNTYNRLKFWILLPPKIKKANGGKKNLTFGTYFRKKNGKKNSAESGGNHPYHYYNIPSSGEWHQIIVDTHPNHIRGVTGSREHGNMPRPTKEKDRNYFDSLTRFYIDMDGSAPNRPAKFLVDHFEFYQANPQENIEQVYSLNAVYKKKSKQIIVGWMRDKNENKVNHEVRYSFADIYNNGWESAKKAPRGLVKPLGFGGYNGMEYRTNKINTANQSVIYIAIKPENSDKFRQIEIPLT